MEIFKKNIKKIKNNIIMVLNSIPKPFIGLIFSILVLISPLLNDEIATGHDYTFHATNMILTNENIDVLKLKLLLPKVFGGTIANTFGYGTGIFYPPLSYYLTSYITYFLNLSNSSNILSITILEIIIITLCGIVMYAFLRKMFKNDIIAGIGSISYISSPYFLCNIYTRTALAEMLTFVFIPLVFWGLYELFFEDEKKFNLLFIIGYIGMIHSHLVLAVYLTIIIILLFLCFPKKVFKKNKIKKLFISSIIILLVSSPYLVPLLEHKFLGDYAVFTTNGMYSEYWVNENTINLNEFLSIINKPNDVKVYINHVVLIAAIISIIFNKKIFIKEKRYIYIITIMLIIVSAYMSSSYFSWKKLPEFLKMIQFPWRLSSFISIGLAILAGNIVKIIKGENKFIIIIMLTFSILLFGYNTISYDKLNEPEPLYNMSMGGENEYLPINTKNNLDYFNNRINNIILKDGSATIKILENNTPYLNSEIQLDSNRVVIELPRLYYLGYKIILTDNTGNKEKVNYYENEQGFIQLELTKSGTLEVSYEGTIANKISNYICLITIITCILVTIYKKKKSNR